MPCDTATVCRSTHRHHGVGPSAKSRPAPVRGSKPRRRPTCRTSVVGIAGRCTSGCSSPRCAIVWSTVDGSTRRPSTPPRGCWTTRLLDAVLDDDGGVGAQAGRVSSAGGPCSRQEPTLRRPRRSAHPSRQPCRASTLQALGRPGGAARRRRLGAPGPSRPGEFPDVDEPSDQLVRQSSCGHRLLERGRPASPLALPPPAHRQID
jgi:hypothetical protein